MTAMSARSASELTASAELASSRHVRVPGTARTYEVRDQLRGLGLRWDPATHAWHGAIRAGEEVVLERELRVRAQVVHPIEAFATKAGPAPPEGPKPPEPGPRAAGEPRSPPRDGSRTRAEARTAYRQDLDEDPEPPIHLRFTVWDVTSGLPATPARPTRLPQRVGSATSAAASRPPGWPFRPTRRPRACSELTGVARRRSMHDSGSRRRSCGKGCRPRMIWMETDPSAPARMPTPAQSPVPGLAPRFPVRTAKRDPLFRSEFCPGRSEAAAD